MSIFLKRTKQSGITVMLVLAFMGIFAVILGTIVSYALEQGKFGRALYAREQALHIAENGLEYYRWFLAHYPNNTTNGTGQSGPYVTNVTDPEGSTLGNYSLAIASSSQCGQVQWIDITSTGTSNADTKFTRTLSARYMQPSVANYAYIMDSNVYQTSNVIGPYHSNGGIHMDGTTNSNVTSAQSTWSCDSTYGCSPTQTKSGIFGNGNTTFWSYPATSIDFAGIALNFDTLRGYAHVSGILLSGTTTRVSGSQVGSSYTGSNAVNANDQRGYRLLFPGDGTVGMYRVTGTSADTSIHVDNQSQWASDYYTITSQVFLATSTIPTNCGIIFSQARTWIEGTISGKVTIIAADTGSYAPDIILNNNISYATTDGTTGLAAVAEHSVLIPLHVPDAMSIRGIFVAQTGYYGRNFYYCASTPYDKRTSLTLQGTVVSKVRIVTYWGYNSIGWGCAGGGSASDWSGFSTRSTNYDQILAFSPPPFTPVSNSTYKFVLWREQ